MQGVSGRVATIEIECGYDCAHCGWDKAVEAERRQRIASGCFSVNERGLAYLSLGSGR